MNGRKARLIRKVHSLLNSNRSRIEIEKESYNQKNHGAKHEASVKLKRILKNLRAARTSKYEAQAKPKAK